jgi:hypothetical protein
MIGTESEEERTKRTRRKLCKCQGDGGAVHGGAAAARRVYIRRGKGKSIVAI